jgi:hypothetical protein
MVTTGRYVHYFERFHGHDIALKFAIEQRKKAPVLPPPGESDRVCTATWTDLEFLRQAVEQVARPRIQYTLDEPV